MSEQPKSPPLAVSIIVTDPQATLDWFGRLGFETTFVMNGPDGKIAHAEVMRGPGVSFMLGPANPAQGWNPGSTGMSVYITLDESIDAYHDRVVKAGVAIDQPLIDQFWGHRTFSVRHPDGYLITFAQVVREVSIEEMEQAMKQMAGATA